MRFFFSLPSRAAGDTGSRAPAGTSYTIWKSFLDLTEIPRHQRAGQGPHMDNVPFSHVFLSKKKKLLCLWHYFHYRAGLFSRERPILHLLFIFDIRPSRQNGDKNKKSVTSAVWIWLRLTSTQHSSTLSSKQCADLSQEDVSNIHSTNSGGRKFTFAADDPRHLT